MNAIIGKCAGNITCYFHGTELDPLEKSVNMLLFLVETDRAIFTMEAPSRDVEEAKSADKKKAEIFHSSHQSTPGEVCVESHYDSLYGWLDL